MTWCVPGVSLTCWHLVALFFPAQLEKLGSFLKWTYPAVVCCLGGQWLETPEMVQSTGCFQHWRCFEKLSQTVKHSFVGQVELGKCGSGVAETSGNNFYTCSLNEEKWIATQPNDIIGMLLPLQSNSAFELHFISSTSAPTNYVFMMEDVSSNVSIPGLPIIKNIPQINLEITSGTLMHITTLAITMLLPMVP